jgi:CBS domain-containing protein
MEKEACTHVESLFVRDVMFVCDEFIAASQSLAFAASKLKQYEVEYLPVERDGKMVGIVTVHDVARAIGGDIPLEEIAVSETLSHPMPYCNLHDDLRTAAIIMIQHDIPYLAVSDGRGNYPGVIRLKDIATLFRDNMEGVSGPLHDAVMNAA